MILEDGAVWIDTSTMRATSRCTTSELIRYGYGLASPLARAPLVSGHAGHAALAEYFRGMAVDSPHRISDAMAVLEREYKDWSLENVPGDDRLAWENVRDLVRYWMETRDGKLPFRVPAPERAEIGFAYPLDESGHYVFFGAMDLQAIHWENESWYIVEHKYTGNASQFWAAQWLYDAQITGYIWAALQHNPDVVGAYVNMIELRNLPIGDDRKCRKHNPLVYRDCRLAHAEMRLLGPITKTEAQLEEWRRTALMLAKMHEDLLLNWAGDRDAVQKMPTQGRFNGHCGLCEFRDFCDMGRVPAHLDVLFQFDPWMPFEPGLGEEAKP